MSELVLKDVFTKLNIEFRNKGRYIMIPCPYHEETEASLAVYQDSLTFYCFGCKKHGRYEEVISKITGIDPIEVSTYFEKKVTKVDYSLRLEFKPAMHQEELHLLLLRGHLVAEKYLKSRGIKNPHTFKCGYDSVADRLAIPVYFEDRLVGFESRALGKEDKYKYKAHYFEKSQYIYGWDYLDWSLNYLIIVESSISVMYLRNTLGWKNCISFMGTVLNARRKELIRSFNPANMFVWFDNDLAGREAANKLLHEFRKILYVSSGKDPDEIESIDEICIIPMEV